MIGALHFHSKTVQYDWCIGHPPGGEVIHPRGIWCSDQNQKPKAPNPQEVCRATWPQSVVTEFRTGKLKKRFQRKFSNLIYRILIAKQIILQLLSFTGRALIGVQ